MNPNLSRHTGILITDERRVLALLGLALAVLFPAIGLPVAIWLRRRALATGDDPYLETVAVQIAAFLLLLCVLVVVIGFTLSVVVPLLGG